MGAILTPVNTADALSILDELLARKLPTERHTDFEPVISAFDAYELGGRDEVREVTTEELSWSGAAQWVLEADVAMKGIFPPGHPLRVRWDSASAVAEGKSWQLGEDSLVRTTRAVLETARKLIRDGRLQSVIDGVRTETVVEVLDLADELNRGRAGSPPAPVPATVLAGGALETHLRHLCDRAGLLSGLTGHGSIDKYKGLLDQARTAGTEIITRGEAKQVTAWADDRNAAAHDPTSFTKSAEAVQLIIEGIRQFIARTSRT